MQAPKKEANPTERSLYDLTLVKACIANADQKAYAELMDRYSHSIRYLISKMVTNEDDNEDLLMVTFSKAFKRLHLYNQEFAFSTWLYKIASNSCIDFIRAQKLKTISIDTPIEDEEGGESILEITSLGLTPEEDLVRKQKGKLLLDIVNNLPPHYKEIIELYYYQDLSVDEICEKLNAPSGTVKAKLYRAREILANILVRPGEKL